MYRDFNRFVESRYQRFHQEKKEGFVGAAVVMTRRALDLIGAWDPRVQAADFDLFIRAKHRSLKEGDLRPCAIALGVYVHHYIRLTSKRERRPFVDQDRHITIEEKWGRGDRRTVPRAHRRLARPRLFGLSPKTPFLTLGTGRTLEKPVRLLTRVLPGRY